MVGWIVNNPEFIADDLNPELAVGPWSGHRNFAYDLVSFLKPTRIVELGTHYGCSFFTFLQASKDFDLGAEHIAVDTWSGDEHAGHYGEEVFQIFNRTVDQSFNEQKVRILRKTFDAALEEVNDSSVDLIHIDGLHTYDAVSHDYLTWLPKLAKDGVVLFHDVAPDSGYGSSIFWNQVKSKLPHFEFLHHSFGLGILFPNGLRNYANLTEYISKNLLDLYQFKAEYSLRDKQYKSAQVRLEERWSAMQSMEAMIGDRDRALSIQRQFKGALQAALEAYLPMNSHDALFKKLGGARPVTPFADMAFSLYLFIARLYDTARQDGARDLLFFAREGWLLKEMFDYYQGTQNKGGGIRTHYIKVSRRSTFLLSLCELKEENFSVLFRQYRRISILDFLKSLDLDDYAEPFASDLDISIDEFGVVREDLPTDEYFKELLKLNAFQEIYENQRTARSNAFDAYIKTSLSAEVLPEELYVVDVGWKGSIQDNIYHWFAKIRGAAVQINGYYVGLVAPGAANKSNRKLGLLFSNVDTITEGFYTFNENRSLFELLLHANHGSAFRYVLDDLNKPVVIDDVFHEKEMIDENISGVSRAIIDLFQEIAATIACVPISEQVLLKITIERHRRMVFAPMERELNWFRSVSHVENFGVFETSWFRGQSAPPNFLARIMFTWQLFKRRRPAALGFWPWLTIQNLALPGLSRLYGFIRAWQDRRLISIRSAGSGARD